MVWWYIQYCLWCQKHTCHRWKRQIYYLDQHYTVIYKYKRNKANNICKIECIQQQPSLFPPSGVDYMNQILHERCTIFLFGPILLQKKKKSISRSHFTYHAYWLQWVGNKKNGAIEFETNDPKGRDIMLSRTRLTISIIFREKKLNEKYLFWQNWGGTSMHSPHLHALFSTRVNKTKLSSFYRLHWASFAIKSFRDSSFIDFF